MVRRDAPSRSAHLSSLIYNYKSMQTSTNSISSEGRGIGLPMFFCLYIAQSIPSSFFATALQVMMREANYSLATIGLLQLVKLPWVLKFLWSPMVDRHCISGRDFRRCIIISECIYALFIVLAGHLNVADNLYLIILLVCLSASNISFMVQTSLRFNKPWSTPAFAH